MQSFFSASPIYLDTILAILRITLGLLLIYHGYEVFDAKLMQGYLEWENFKGPSGTWLVYLGKGSEFVAGILLTLGLFTRVGALICMGTLAYITFFIGHGKFWYEDQHPFMFVMFGVLFLFAGGGKWSLDGILFGSKK
ncbi:MAG: DoxX family protein [Haliscomenobacter sp.]|uniref:DoxX family protein n=1 Tax=Haliscomenobacter sp. TaxID=2717303 RepID=UPI0029B518FF|nr:DoxX family protein [Haliscomenobacter sp.]MDX2070057.1 DoxX family protein [Haliscomenobacter sp.]